MKFYLSSAERLTTRGLLVSTPLKLRMLPSEFHPSQSPVAMFSLATVKIVNKLSKYMKRQPNYRTWFSSVAYPITLRFFLSVRIVANNIYNGVQTAKLQLNLPIPPTIFVAGELVRIWYLSQPKMCRRCGDVGHVAAKCSLLRCFHCEGPGHQIENCTSLPLCSICLGADHNVSFAPFYYTAQMW